MESINKKQLKALWLKQLNKLILAHLSDSYLTNAVLASELSISNRMLYRKILKLTKQSPNQYIRTIRLREAHKFLQSGGYFTVREVAGKVGFKKASYFSALFKTEFGVTPMEVLKRCGFK